MQANRHSTGLGGCHHLPNLKVPSEHYECETYTDPCEASSTVEMQQAREGSPGSVGFIVLLGVGVVPDLAHALDVEADSLSLLQPMQLHGLLAGLPIHCTHSCKSEDKLS